MFIGNGLIILTGRDKLGGCHPSRVCLGGALCPEVSLRFTSGYRMSLLQSLKVSSLWS